MNEKGSLDESKAKDKMLDQMLVCTIFFANKLIKKVDINERKIKG